MQRLTLLLAALSFSAATFAQKADVKKDEILSDGQSIAKIEKDGCGALSPTCNYYVNSLHGEPLITVVALGMIDPTLRTSGNPDGAVRFLRFSFTGFDGVAEIPNPAMLTTRPKDVAQTIVKARLIKDNKLDETAVNNFIKANGERFTQRQKEINSQVIIIDNRR